MPVQIDVQYACKPDKGLPTSGDFQRWANAALRGDSSAEVVIRIVDEDESRELNHHYRGKDKPTNVLSFPMELPEELAAAVDENMLGDLIICAPVVAHEAQEQHKIVQHHWAHMKPKKWKTLK